MPARPAAPACPGGGGFDQAKEYTVLEVMHRHISQSHKTVCNPQTSISSCSERSPHAQAVMVAAVAAAVSGVPLVARLPTSVAAPAAVDIVAVVAALASAVVAAGVAETRPALPVLSRWWVERDWCKTLSQTKPLTLSSLRSHSRTLEACTVTKKSATGDPKRLEATAALAVPAR